MRPFEFDVSVVALLRDGSSKVIQPGPGGPVRVDGFSVGAECVESLHPGQAILVPRGVWHRVDVREPSRLVHITPGPGGGHRPL